LPALAAGSDVGAVRARGEEGLLGAVGVNFVNAAPEADGKTGEVSGSEGGGFEHGGPCDGKAEEVGLELEQQVIGGGTAIDAELGDGVSGFRLHGFDYVADLESDAFECGAGDMAGGGAAMESDNEAAGVWVPVGCAEAGEGRDEDDAAGVGNGCGEVFDIAGVPYEAEIVAESLDDGSADKD
jgi:hypothetical protein